MAAPKPPPYSSDEDWIERTLLKLSTTPKSTKQENLATLESWVKRARNIETDKKTVQRSDTAPMPEDTGAWTSNVLSSLHEGRRSPVGKSSGEGQRQQIAYVKIVPDVEITEEEERREGSKQMAQLRKMLPDHELVIERLRGGGGGFSESEEARIRSTFMRFRVPDSMDVHKDDIPTILQHLGYHNLDKRLIMSYADEITEYSTLELSDFMRLVEKHSKAERDDFKATFDSFDEDGNGTLDRNELTKYLASMGYTVLRKMVNEAMDLVDLDQNGCLDFEETGLLMALYRNSEGFTQDEIDTLYTTFREQDIVKEQGDYCLPANKLKDVLTRFFGPHASSRSKEIEEELRSIGGVQSGGHDDEKKKDTQGLNFSEVMLWARRLRDKDFTNYKEAFSKFDADGSGTIDTDELRVVISTLGYTLLPEVIKEAVEEAKLRGCGDEEEAVAADELDFDEFVHLMEIFRETSGFSKKEVEEINDAFDRFDEDGSGDIDSVELSDVLHSMGHTLKLDDAEKLIAKSDCNGNGVLDRREFQMLMRFRREEELIDVKEAFADCANAKGVIPAGNVRIAWTQLQSETLEEDGGANPFLAMQEDANIYEGTDDLDMDGFIRFVDNARLKVIETRKKRAGFTDGELRKFKRMFDELDIRKEEVLESTEVQKLVVTLGFDMQKTEDQEEFRSNYEHSRLEVMGTSHGKVNFWVVVHLLRKYYKRDDRRSLSRVTKAAQVSRFTMAEVTQFRDVFTTWWDKDRVFEPATDEETEEEKKELTSQSLRRLLKSMGVTLSSDDRLQLDKKVEEFDETNGNAVDFANFLKIMRWMLDSNFGNITGAGKEKGKK